MRLDSQYLARPERRALTGALAWALSLALVLAGLLPALHTHHEDRHPGHSHAPAAPEKATDCATCAVLAQPRADTTSTVLIIALTGAVRWTAAPVPVPAPRRPALQPQAPPRGPPTRA